MGSTVHAPVKGMITLHEIDGDDSEVVGKAATAWAVFFASYG